jgi:hypothetical protein
VCLQVAAVYQYHLDRPPWERDSDRLGATKTLGTSSLGATTSSTTAGEREGQARGGRGDYGATSSVSAADALDGMGRGWQLPFRASLRAQVVKAFTTAQ